MAVDRYFETYIAIVPELSKNSLTIVLPIVELKLKFKRPFKILARNFLSISIFCRSFAIDNNLKPYGSVSCYLFHVTTSYEHLRKA